MAKTNYETKRDVRLQIFVTSKVDDRLDEMAEIMGLTKNELVRYFISQGLMGYDAGVKVLREQANKLSVANE